MLFLYCVVVPRVVLENPLSNHSFSYVPLSSLNLQMEGLKAMLQPCDENTLRGILVELCAMFQRDYLNVPKLHEGKLKIEHVETIVQEGLAKQRLAGAAREEDHTDPHCASFDAEAVPNLFPGQYGVDERSLADIIALNHLMQRCSEDTLKNMVVRLCESFQEDGQDCVVEGPYREGDDDEGGIEILYIESVRNTFYDALTDELHTVLLQQETDRRAFAVVRGSDQKAKAQQYRLAKAGGRKQAWTGLLSVSADVLALIASFLAREKVRAQREWKVGHECQSLDSVQFSRCGNFALAYSEDGNGSEDSFCLELWHTTSGMAKLSLHGLTSPINECCFSPDGKAIVGAFKDCTLKVWSANLGSLVRTLEGHTYAVVCVDVSHDSTRILSVSDVLFCIVLLCHVWH